MDFSKFESDKIKEEFLLSITNETRKIFKSVKSLQNIVLTFHEGQLDCSASILYENKLFELEEGSVIIDNEEYYNLLDTVEKIKELGGNPTKTQLKRLKVLENYSPICAKDEKLINDSCTDLYKSLSDLNLLFLGDYYQLKLNGR